jgi:AcrR family transcriptional regulator
MELLGAGGADAVTVRAVCEGARLNPRYFYESFADRDRLLVALYDDVAEGLGVEIVHAMAAAGDDLAGATRAGIETVFRYVAADPRRARILYTEAVGLEPLARRRLAATDALITAIAGPVEAAAAAGLTRVPAVAPIDVVAASMFTGGVSAILTGWLGGRIDRSLDDLIDEAVVLALAVFAAASDRPPTRPAPAGRSRRR